jgi:CDP-paratose 2-epimerase
MPLGTLNLLEAVRERVPDSTVIYLSTNNVYGDLEHLEYQGLETRYICPQYPKGFDESIPLDFYSPYGCYKGAADQ